MSPFGFRHTHTPLTQKKTSTKKEDRTKKSVERSSVSSICPNFLWWKGREKEEERTETSFFWRGGEERKWKTPHITSPPLRKNRFFPTSKQKKKLPGNTFKTEKNYIFLSCCHGRIEINCKPSSQYYYTTPH